MAHVGKPNIKWIIFIILHYLFLCDFPTKVGTQQIIAAWYCMGWFDFLFIFFYLVGKMINSFFHMNAFTVWLLLYWNDRLIKNFWTVCGIYIVHGILISDSNPLWNCLFYFCPYYPFRMRIYEFTFFDVNGSLKKIIAYEDETCQTKLYFKKSGWIKKYWWVHNFWLGELCEWSWKCYRNYWEQNDKKIEYFLAK